MKHFVFCHGFGFDKSFWEKLSPYFSQNRCTHLDLGYFYDAHEDIKDDNDTLVGVGHSIGLIKLLSTNKKFDYLIGLNGFVNFLGNNPDLRKKREKDLSTLKTFFAFAPMATLKGFYDRCGTPSFTDNKKINSDKLRSDLALLFSTFSIPSSIPTLIIGSQDDIIAPEQLLHDNFDQSQNVKVEILPTGQHGLGFLEVDKIHGLIDGFVENKN